MAQPALDIYQSFLEAMDSALLAADAGAFLSRIFLPHLIETEDSTILIEDIDSAERHFTGFVQALASQDVDGYIRVAGHAQYDGQDEISGRHKTFITSSGKLVVPAFDNEMRLVCKDGAWGATGTRHYARYVSWPDLLPRARP